MITVKCRRGRADEFAAGVDQRKLRTPIDVRLEGLISGLPLFLFSLARRAIGRPNA